MHINISPYIKKMKELKDNGYVGDFMAWYSSRFKDILNKANESVTNEELLYNLRLFYKLHDSLSYGITINNDYGKIMFQTITAIMNDLEAKAGISLRELDSMTSNPRETRYFPRRLYWIGVEEEYNTRMPYFHVKAQMGEHYFRILLENGEFDVQVSLNGEIMKVIGGDFVADYFLPYIRRNIKKWMVCKPAKFPEKYGGGASCFRYNIQRIMYDYLRVNRMSAYCRILDKEIERLETEEANLDKVYGNIKSNPKVEYTKWFSI